VFVLLYLFLILFLSQKQQHTLQLVLPLFTSTHCTGLLTDGYYNYKMDIWGIGCVWFEILSLFPLFPGTNELDQIQRIHNVLGTPSREVLARMRRHCSHINFQFPERTGTGLARLLPNANPECLELLSKMLAYNPDDRISARAALSHPYFRELREMERLRRHGVSPARMLVGSSSTASTSGPVGVSGPLVANTGVVATTTVVTNAAAPDAVTHRSPVAQRVKKPAPIGGAAATAAIAAHKGDPAAATTATTAGGIGATRFPHVLVAERTPKVIKPESSPASTVSGPLPLLKVPGVRTGQPLSGPHYKGPVPAPRGPRTGEAFPSELGKAATTPSDSESERCSPDAAPSSPGLPPVYTAAHFGTAMASVPAGGASSGVPVAPSGLCCAEHAGGGAVQSRRL